MLFVFEHVKRVKQLMKGLVRFGLNNNFQEQFSKKTSDKISDRTFQKMFESLKRGTVCVLRFKRYISRKDFYCKT